MLARKECGGKEFGWCIGEWFTGGGGLPGVFVHARVADLAAMGVDFDPGDVNGGACQRGGKVLGDGSVGLPGAQRPVCEANVVMSEFNNLGACAFAPFKSGEDGIAFAGDIAGAVGMAGIETSGLLMRRLTLLPDFEGPSPRSSDRRIRHKSHRRR